MRYMTYIKNICIPYSWEVNPSVDSLVQASNYCKIKTAERFPHLTLLQPRRLLLHEEKLDCCQKGGFAGMITNRAGNEPRYSGSARKKLGSGSTSELNELSLSLNLGLINLGLDSSGPIRRWNEASAYGLRSVGSGLHWCDPDSGAPE